MSATLPRTCPSCHGRLVGTAAHLACDNCGRCYEARLETRYRVPLQPHIPSTWGITAAQGRAPARGGRLPTMGQQEERAGKRAHTATRFRH